MRLLVAVGITAVLSTHLFISETNAACSKNKKPNCAQSINSNYSEVDVIDNEDPDDPDDKYMVVCCEAGTTDHTYCPRIPFSYCNGDDIEVIREENKADSITTSTCCPPGDKDINFFETNAKVCRLTNCISKTAAENSENICAQALAKRLFLNGTEVNFIETTRDECNDADGQSGVAGTAAVCCVPDSQDLYFSTLYGAEPQEFPYFARVGSYGCGGMIYNEQWVLTASHCVVNHENGNNRVWDAALDGQEEWENNVAQVRLNLQMRDATSKHTYNVTEVHVHPKSTYLHPQADLASIYDVALLKLDRKIAFGETVKAVKFAEPGFNPLDHGNRALVTGFGDTDTLQQPADRRKANMHIRSKDADKLFTKYHDQMLFTGGITSESTSSNFGKGDSGGPLLCRGKDGLAVLCGAVGFLVYATADCLANLDSDKCHPSTFSDLQYFNEWIQSVAGGQENAEMMDERYLYGQAVETTEFPAHVHIKSSGGGDGCGGTLIDDDVVLTAASCVVDDSGEFKDGVEVFVGVTDLNAGGGKTFGVKSFMVMEDFGVVRRPAWGGGRKKRVVSIVLEAWQNSKLDNKAIMKDPYYKNNIALIKLNGKSGVGNNAVTLATISSKTGDMAMEVAYPLKSVGTANNGKILLTKRDFKILDKTKCQSKMDTLKPLNFNVKIDDNVVCGVENFSGGSMCDRELGGGLYCKGENGQYNVLCGVQVGRLCEFNIPNEFVDVAKINSWLSIQQKQLK